MRAGFLFFFPQLTKYLTQLENLTWKLLLNEISLILISYSIIEALGLNLIWEWEQGTKNILFSGVVSKWLIIIMMDIDYFNWSEILNLR